MKTVWMSSDWYWRLAEDTTALTLDEAARCFARPLLGQLEQASDVAIADDALTVTFATRETRIALTGRVTDRIAIHHLIADLNRILNAARLALAFAILVPRRYELCGALLTIDELDRLHGDSTLRVPSSRRSSL